MRLVFDASALVEFLIDDAASELQPLLDPRDNVGVVPTLCDVELIGGLLRQQQRGRVTEHDAAEALIDYVSLPLERHHHLGHIGRIWQLRENFSPADAAYVALAESLDAALVTVDQRLAEATRSYTTVPVLP